MSSQPAEHHHPITCASEPEFRDALARIGAGGLLVKLPPGLELGAELRLVVSSAGGFQGQAAAKARVGGTTAEGAALTVLEWEPNPLAPQAFAADQTLGISIEAQPMARDENSVKSVVTRGGRNVTAPGEDKPRTTGRELRPFDVLSSFQILKPLGTGGMAEVYVARAMLGGGVDKLVALKTVLPEFGPDTRFGSMFLSEARVSATLRHQNLVQVFAFGEAAGRAYLSMEYIHGRDLTAVIKRMKARRQLLGVDFGVTVAIELCRALEYVHSRKDLDGTHLNLVHRDVSPGNVLLSDHAEVKLMDFGVAAVSGAQTVKGLLVGKVPYMMLSQARGEQPVPQWDLFAVGVLLYEMITLVRPYRNVPLAQLPASREGEIVRPSQLNPQVPPELDDLVVRACTEATAFSSATDLRLALERVQAQVGVSDVGLWLKALFGEELAREQQEIEALTLEGRKRSGFREPGAVASPLMRRALAVRRRIASTRTWMRLSQRPGLLRGIAAGLLLAVLGGVGLGGYGAYKERQIQARLRRADAQALAGRLVGPTGTEMLGQLLEARRLKGDDPRVSARLTLLADRLETLGDAALARTNREEAAAHFAAALEADPSRATIAARLRQIEEEILRASRGRVVRQQ